MFAISLSSTSHTHTAYTTSAVRPSARRRGQRHWCYRMHIRVPELWLNCILNNVIKLISRNIPLPYCCYYVCIVLYIRRSSISIIFPLSSVKFFTRTSGTLVNCNITGGPEYPVHFIHNSLGAMLLFIILSRHGSLCVCVCGASLDEHTNFIFAFTGSLFLSLISLLLAAANVCDGPFYAVRFNSSRLQSFHCAAANSEQSLGRSHPRCSLITPKARESLASHHLFPSFGLQNAFTSFLPHLAVLLHFLQSHITRWCMERDIPNAKRETNIHKREKSGNDSHWRWFLLLHRSLFPTPHNPPIWRWRIKKNRSSSKRDK